MFNVVNKALKNRKGFTLVELMVVVAIIGILVAVAVPMFNSTTTGASQQAHDANLRTLDGAIDQYRAAVGAWPSQLSDLNTYVKGASTLVIPSGISVTGAGSANYTFTAGTNGARPTIGPAGGWTGHYVPQS
ncbi:prepilin-type N-terminal cleavage/methylation domain-containing protein [Heliobacterium chlorum]|uniref:Prepilin-type N-terminal cleavage/methylation domain-containing protein n=1 Tax=Heliobacterium chlorum TaxID=2698 RepID=A0ABR7T420_HELCL|nr:prepilin-type N-terminal cleavage/methylation domain-containing protein [Heliobacterium chlorum]MBC9784947.1 prepilin-type N-terminal cleavage/methylation domain-containing protein [Heliobacterium chlorum]